MKNIEPWKILLAILFGVPGILVLIISQLNTSKRNKVILSFSLVVVICLCLSTLVFLAVTQEPTLNLREPSKNYASADSPSYDVKLSCIKVDEIKLNNKMLSSEELEALCSSGLNIDLVDGKNTLKFIGNPNAEKSIETTITIEFDRDSYDKQVEGERQEAFMKFNGSKQDIEGLISNYDDIYNQLNTNVLSYQVYEYFSINNYKYTECSVFQIDMGKDNLYPEDALNKINKLKKDVQNYCLYMGGVGEGIMDYNESRSNEDFKKINDNIGKAKLSLESIKLGLSEIELELGS